MNIEFVSPSLDFCPRGQLVQRLMTGWSKVPGFKYDFRDWAFLLNNDGKIRSRAAAERLAIKIRGKSRPVTRMSTREAGRISAQATTFAKYGTLCPSKAVMSSMRKLPALESA